MGIKIVFRVSGEDARILARSVGDENLSAKLVSLPDGRALVWMRGGFRKDERIVEISTLPLVYRNPFLRHVIERMRELFEIVEEAEYYADPEVYELLNILLELGSAGMSEIFERYRKIMPGLRASYVSALAERAEKLGFVKRNVVKQKRGRPKIIVELSEKALELLGLAEQGSARAGGELHMKLARAYAEKLRKNGCAVIFLPQLGKEEQPDMIAFRRATDGWEEIAVEVETRADHPEQVLRNYKKNVHAGRRVVFVVPNEKVAKRIRRILKVKNDYTIEILGVIEKRE